MSSTSGSIKIFCGNANVPLANEIAEYLSNTIGEASVTKFSDGETTVRINETIRGSDIFIIQPTCSPCNDNLMELLIMIDAMKRASAGNINAVMPYFGYARQDRKARARDPISAKLVANLLTTAGADRIITMDFHSPQIQGFFDIPVDHLFGLPILTKYYKKKYGSNTSNMVAVSPDLGSVTRTRRFAEKLDIPLAIIDKRRPKDNISEVVSLIGDVDGKHVILIDDMIDTGGTLCNAADFLTSQGAISVEACCTHPVLSGNATEKIEKSCIEEVVSLNTITLSADKCADKIKQLSVAPIFAEAINRIHSDSSVSKLFD